MRSIELRLVGTLVLVAACGEVESRATGTWSLESAGVLFDARRHDNVDIYRVVLGGDTLRLTNHTAPDNFGRLSPDGSRIAFQSRRTGAIDIYVMNADGSDAVNLTRHEAYDVLPAWSPDGSSIAFMSTRGFTAGGTSFHGHIYAVRPDGSHLRQLTMEPLTSSLGPQDWTPDGSSILLSRESEGSLDLFLLDIATGEETRLTSDPGDEYGASVSHDGTRIAFHVEADSASNIYVMQRDGSDRRAITTGPGLRYSPRWSPDDAWLLFTVQGAGGERDYDIKAVRVADGEIVDVVVTPEDERYGEWIG